MTSDGSLDDESMEAQAARKYGVPAILWIKLDRSERRCIAAWCRKYPGQGMEWVQKRLKYKRIDRQEVMRLNVEGMSGRLIAKRFDVSPEYINRMLKQFRKSGRSQ